MLFTRGKRTAKKRPAFIVTDGLPAYQDACRREFYTPTAEKTNHVSLANISGFVNNNVIERLHGTIRERNKVMRGLGNNGSAPEILEGFKINFFSEIELVCSLRRADPPLDLSLILSSDPPHAPIFSLMRRLPLIIPFF